MNFKSLFKPISCLTLGATLAGCQPDSSRVLTDESTTPVIEHAPVLILNKTQVKLANISVQVARMGTIRTEIPVTGKLVSRQEETQTISTRIAGRIDRLFVREPGKVLSEGTPLFEIYSEPLLAIEQEYILALRQKSKSTQEDPRLEQIIQASEKKLKLYGLRLSQLEELKNGKVNPRITFLAPGGGVLKEILVTEGQYLNEGAPLYTTENTRTLWVEADAYEDEVRHLRVGSNIAIELADGSRQETKIDFIAPTYAPATQAVKLRATVRNETGTLVAGMAAQVWLTTKSRSGITLPVDAVIRDQRGTHVYVQTEPFTFVPRMIQTGLENSTEVEVLAGLSEGDTVVSSGAYLLYSEFVLKHGITPGTHH